MNKTGRMVSRHSPAQQRGFVFKFLHSVLIVVAVVGLAWMYKMGRIPTLHDLQTIPHMPNLSHWGNNGAWKPQYSPDYSPSQHSDAPAQRHEDPGYMDVRYAVQAAAGYDSRQLKDLQQELAHDGYDAYLVSLNTADGLLFKLRVGAYEKRSEAEAVRNKLRTRYPDRFGASFVIQGK